MHDDHVKSYSSPNLVTIQHLVACMYYDVCVCKDLKNRGVLGVCPALFDRCLATVLLLYSLFAVHICIVKIYIMLDHGLSLQFTRTYQEVFDLFIVNMH